MMTVRASGSDRGGAVRSAWRRLAACALVALVACGNTADPPAPEAPIGTEVGQRAPELTGQLPDGSGYSLRDALGTPTVLIFYRSVECGLCRVQLEGMRANLEAYRRAGADLVTVTLDPPELSRAWLDQAELGFPGVSVDSATFRAWGALDADRAVPLPASYVMDARGVVRFRHIGRNASDRTSDAEAIAILEALRGT